jgi:hypothetical protein
MFLFLFFLVSRSRFGTSTTFFPYWLGNPLVLIFFVPLIIIVGWLLMYPKIPIHYSWANDTLVFFKVTSNIFFPPLFKYQVPIVICHMFVNRLTISLYTKDFFNWKLPCMSRHSKGRFFFQNTWISGCHIFMSMVIIK